MGNHESITEVMMMMDDDTQHKFIKIILSDFPLPTPCHLLSRLMSKKTPSLMSADAATVVAVPPSSLEPAMPALISKSN
jgi:hypothetical protein